MKQVSVTMHQDLRQLSSPSPWLTLLEIEFPDGIIERIVANPEPIVFRSVTYVPFPFELGATQSDVSGGLHDVEVRISNVTRLMSAYVETKELRGTRVRVLTVNAARLSDPNAVLEELEYEVNEYTVTEEVVTVRLGHDQLLVQRAPYGRLVRDNCRWVYNFPYGRSWECGAATFTGPGRVQSTSGITVTITGDDCTKRWMPGDSITTGFGEIRVVQAVLSQTQITVVSPFSSNLVGPMQYNVTKPTCEKTLEGPNGCRAHSNQNRFGGFPGIPLAVGR